MKSAGLKSKLISRAAIVAVLAVGAALLLPTVPSYAQDSALPTNLVNVTLYQAPVTTALKALFNGTNLNYTVDPAVTGVVTCSLRSIPFDVALRSILRSADPPLEYTVDDGVYSIHPKVEEVDINPSNVNSQPSSTVNTTDTTDQSTEAQVFPIHLEYANAALILRYALSGAKGGTTGYIPSLDSPPTSGGTNGGGGGTNSGMSGGMSGMSGMSGGSSGFGGSSGGFSTGSSSSFGGGGGRY